MSNELMAMAWGILFCLPATVILAFWYRLDTRKRGRGSESDRLDV